MSGVEDVVAFFSELFPIRSERFSLELVCEHVDETTGEVFGGADGQDGGDLRATMRTIGWDVEDGVQSIRDVKEQQVVWLLARHREDARARAYLQGWAQAVQFVLERHEELRAAGTLTEQAAQRIDYSMPYEFMGPDVLDLRRPQTADEFTDALLSSKKRLGGLLP